MNLNVYMFNKVSYLRTTVAEFNLFSFHLIERQQSGSASLHAYYYVYIQHMH